MGKLILLSDFNATSTYHVEWYFPDARWGGHSRDRWNFSIASGFPFTLYMHKEKFRHHDQEFSKFRVEARKFIERTFEGDVVVSEIEKNYRVYDWSVDITNISEYDNSYYKTEEIEHGYIVFNFETGVERIAFQLRFAEFLDEVCEVNPYKEWTHKRRVKPRNTV